MCALPIWPDARRHTGRYGFRQFHGKLRRSRMDMLGSLAFYIPAFVLVLLFLTAAIKILREYRSEEHTSELQSLMRTSYAVFCLKKKTSQPNTTSETT